MALSPGTRLGPYEIHAPLGAGGMGEVYQAKDTRLERMVAIKVLPSDLSADPGLQQRFEREARAVSSLNHPNICTLHDVGRQGDTAYLVMEYIEGETLSARLQKGPLPVRELLQYAMQVAAALDKAHKNGIIHRDLKPGNIMLTRTGVKLLDFGLARLEKEQARVSEVSSLPTRQRELTREGVILGTLQYMAPEQLEGKPCDARTDIFAFGAVLYEMASGKKAFEGQSQASLIGAILKEEPKPLSSHHPLTPPALERLVKTCLAKDPEDRWQSAHDVKTELNWIQESASQPEMRVAAAPQRKWTHRLALVLAFLSVVALITAVVTNLKREAPAAKPVYSSILPPEGTHFVSSFLFAGPVVMSPDGTKMAFIAQAGDSTQLLWVRSLDSPKAVPLKGTDGAQMPFWSPDSRFIGFFANRKLKKIEATGGPVFNLARIGEARGGTWNSEGQILFSPSASGPLLLVSAEGGPVKQATQLKTTESTHRYPFFLPDGHHYLYLVRSSVAGPGSESGIYVGSLDSADRKLVVPIASNVLFASGYLLYMKEDALMAQKFDLKSLTTQGEAVTIAEDVRMDERFSRGVFSASQNGRLVYQTGKLLTESQLTWFDRSGKVLGTVGDPAQYFNGGNIHIAPDEKHTLSTIIDLRTGLSELWLVDIASGSRNRVAVSQNDYGESIWSPDGKRIAYEISDGARAEAIYLKTLDGTARDEKIFSYEDQTWPCSWSPDGANMLYSTRVGRNTGAAFDDLRILSLAGNRQSVQFQSTDTHETMGQFSPDGKFIAYISDESGQDEVYITSFPEANKWQVSQNGGTEPRWSRDGSEIFYFAPDNRLMAAQIKIEGMMVQVKAIEPLFESRKMGLNWRYDVSADGQRFLVNRALPETGVSPITLVLSWSALLDSNKK